MLHLDEALLRRSEEGTPIGAERMIERLNAELESSEVPTLQTGREPITRRPLRWRAALAFIAAVVLVLATIGVVGLLREEPSDVVDTPDLSIVEPPVETTLPADAGAPPPTVIPSLGEGWDVILSTRSGDNPILEPFGLFRTGMGSYVLYFDNVTETSRYRLMTFDGGQPSLVDIEAPLSGFTDGGPGVVAWANTGPETDLEAQFWVSTDGIGFERVAPDLLIGCDAEPNCHGTEILTATGSPDGRVVALAYDGLVWDPETGNYDVTVVALVSNDGYEWTRHPIDLLTVLPEEWEGWADVRKPLVYVNGRWLTFGIHYYNDGYSTDLAFFASTDGMIWEPVDTGDLFNETYLEEEIAANGQGVVTVAHNSIYWSPDGLEWTRVANDVSGTPVALDDGYALIEPDTMGGSLWYSPDGLDWTPMPYEFDEPTHWNEIVGYGSDIMAVGATETNLRGIWHWEP